MNVSNARVCVNVLREIGFKVDVEQTGVDCVVDVSIPHFIAGGHVFRMKTYSDLEPFLAGVVGTMRLMQKRATTMAEPVQKNLDRIQAERHGNGAMEAHFDGEFVTSNPFG